ncbi:MAG: hypothetical protein A2430_01855 [Candidatus Liptonbacteria bacterium RIFOXYC1_FULL_36_8]|uniref:Aspartate--tRNA(Asp/Asn) ligase n=3 Tax=Candidatus Liptoniibacteriota TaxID=1817909 RepID=A0A1G2CQ44_9BACT|nr:MAG: hypothetical protein A2390_02980 [Candidatus Liptonbacteria bacterium RIFOXYB1_FULL_36_10]OGZ04408.1 MAG: hypothetical protein A2430_01855 [Candidatus Liptonbacteria bacterium RIFOXYC1_FULL_36_8]OGZ04567.1 MAG: hypothetical protein A2604_01490 [Candidatus Liptonbacteria bacterium RIFOXYD1_FULL_36_11]
MERTLVREIIKNEGEKIILKGWVAARRDHGKLVFIDLRDRSGIAQVVFSPGFPEAHKTAQDLRSEWVIQVSGKVKERPASMINEKIPTGRFEIEAEELVVLNTSETPPFPLDESGDNIDEEVRLKYRYLDLRRERLQKNIKLRSEFVDRMRQFLFKNDFTEIETPLLTKTTPEGSRDFIVPSRMYPGKFFALPQSPQQYKQLLMVAGFERYFQIARCLRDEDLRADRGFEHTQVDIEMSFVEQKDVLAIDEKMITTVCEEMGKKIKQKPFPVFTYKEAMEKYRADKFDMRTEEEKKDGVLAFAWVVDFPFFEKDKEGNWTFTHNPFSMPKPEHIDWLLKGENIGEIITQQYDLVCNGYEVGGGSIRSHRADILKAVFKVMGYSDMRIEAEFGHMMQAFNFGAPPHGGLAHGVERMTMILTGETYLREVQAFPQTSSGRTSVMDAPSELDEKQLKELGLEVKKK